MNPKKWSILAGAAVLLALYNGMQPDMTRMRTRPDAALAATPAERQKRKKERYGPSMEWLDRLMVHDKGARYVKLDFGVLSSMMIAGLASGFRSQVANLLWMKSDEYWHKGMPTRQVPLMEAVVTLDPQFVDAWSTAGWHWAYNIYADLQDRTVRPDLAKDPGALRAEQERAVQVGLDYLERGSAANPETYRLWFEDAWTRAKKAGIYDERTVQLMREARSKPDARKMEITLPNQKKPSYVEGMDLVGRNIGHIYEDIPDIDKALQQYRDLLRDNGGKGNPPTDQEIGLLRAAGKYWGRYGSAYADMAGFYKGSDAVVQAQIKKLVPDIDGMVVAQAMRDKMAAREPQATGAYVSIVARYLPAWELKKAGKDNEAIATSIGVMNVDTRYHLKGLPLLERVLTLRGDAPDAIRGMLDRLKQGERDSSQDIGLSLLAKLYEQTGQPLAAYRTWYRGRERNQLNFYARRNTLLLEDQYHFQPPQDIIAQIKASRHGGAPEAAPPPNVPQYQGGGHHE
jgi:tetratricopeptide (TPR) repeat protein